MLELHIVDVKHGNAAILVDSKQITIFDVGLKQRLLQYLLDNNINNIDSIIISHADADHAGGLIDILVDENIHVSRIYVNTDPEQKSATWRAIRSALKIVAESSAVNVGNIHTGTSQDFNAGLINVEIVAPDTDTVLAGIGGQDANGNLISRHSLNVVVKLGDNRRDLVLLPGDINNDGLELIEKNGKSIKAEVMIFPHHGGNPGSKDPIKFTETIFEMVNPNIVVFSVGDKHKSHPRDEILRKIIDLDNHCVMLSTGDALALSEIIDKNAGCNHKNKLGNIIFQLGRDPIEY